MTKHKTNEVIGLGGTSGSVMSADSSRVIFHSGQQAKISLPPGSRVKFKAFPAGVDLSGVPSDLKASDLVNLPDDVLVLRAGDDLILRYSDGIFL